MFVAERRDLKIGIVGREHERFIQKMNSRTELNCNARIRLPGFEFPCGDYSAGQSRERAVIVLRTRRRKLSRPRIVSIGRDKENDGSIRLFSDGKYRSGSTTCDQQSSQGCASNSKKHNSSFPPHALAVKRGLQRETKPGATYGKHQQRIELQKIRTADRSPYSVVASRPCVSNRIGETPVSIRSCVIAPVKLLPEFFNRQKRMQLEPRLIKNCPPEFPTARTAARREHSSARISKNRRCRTA